jgi:hypothetical protein
MTLNADDRAYFRKVRRLVLFAVPSWLLLYPCVKLSIVFFLNDSLYETTLHDPYAGKAFVDVIRSNADRLATTEWFRCSTRRVPDLYEQDRRELLLVALSRVDGDAGARCLSVPHTKYLDELEFADGLNLPLLRRGAAINREYSKLYLEQQDLELKKVEPFCKAQEERARWEEPPLPPIKIYGEARQLLLRGADRMEATLARYAEVRGWLRALFYSWIAYSILGQVCAVLIVRLYRRKRASLTEAGAKPPAAAG